MTLEHKAVQISGLRPASSLHTQIADRMRAMLAPIQLEPASAQVAFFDDNGPRGGRAIRCALTVRLPYRPALRVEHTAESPRLAFDAGYAAVERLVERYRERERESRRHPKKYFAAKRVIEGAPARRSRAKSRHA
jgi:hypothetical protein